MIITNWSERIQGIKGLDMSRELRFSERIMDQIIDRIHLEDNMHVLEVGCGPGTLTRKLATSGFDKITITGIDMDSNFIEYCIKQAKELNLGNVNYHIGDALSLPYEDNSFDIITSHTVIEHVPNREFLQEQFRVCKPNGHVSVMNVRPELSLSSSGENQSPREIELLTKISGITKESKKAMNVGSYFDKPENIMRLFEEIGFGDIQLDVIPYVTCVDDYRNSLEIKKQIIESDRNSILEFIDIGICTKPDIITAEERSELVDIINNRFDKRISLINIKSIWDFSISPMIIITGRKLTRTKCKVENKYTENLQF